MVNTIYLLSFVETPRKFIIAIIYIYIYNAIINLRGVSTKLNKYIFSLFEIYFLFIFILL